MQSLKGEDRIGEPKTIRFSCQISRPRMDDGRLDSNLDLEWHLQYKTKEQKHVLEANSLTIDRRLNTTSASRVWMLKLNEGLWMLKLNVSLWMLKLKVEVERGSVNVEVECDFVNVEVECKTMNVEA